MGIMTVLIRESRASRPNFTTNTIFKRREVIVIYVRAVSSMVLDTVFVCQIILDTALFFRVVDHSEKTFFVGYVAVFTISERPILLF